MTNAERVVAVSLLGALLVPFAALAQPAASRVDLAEHHEFVIENFRTESGVTLPQARIVYGTYGHLNAARNNAVLLPSHYMADHHGYEWIIGPGRAIVGPGDLWPRRLIRHASPLDCCTAQMIADGVCAQRPPAASVSVSRLRPDSRGT